MKNIKVALRYCGGCNPRYGRAALVSRLQEAVPEVELEICSGPPEAYQASLVVCGCTARCADQSDLPAGPRLVVSTADSFEQAAAFLRGLKGDAAYGLENLL